MGVAIVSILDNINCAIKVLYSIIAGLYVHVLINDHIRIYAKVTMDASAQMDPAYWLFAHIAKRRTA